MAPLWLVPPEVPAAWCGCIADLSSGVLPRRAKQRCTAPQTFLGFSVLCLNSRFGARLGWDHPPNIGNYCCWPGRLLRLQCLMHACALADCLAFFFLGRAAWAADQRTLRMCCCADALCHAAVLPPIIVVLFPRLAFSCFSNKCPLLLVQGCACAAIRHACPSGRCTSTAGICMGGASATAARSGHAGSAGRYLLW